MTYGGKMQSNAVVIFTNKSSVTSSTYTVDSIKGNAYSLSFSATKKITTLRNSIVIPQAAVEKTAQGLTRMGITNVEATSAGLLSSQQYEPANAVTAAAIWTKGGNGEISITTAVSYTVQPEYLSYSILMGRD
jgi:hypothetical protein